MSCSASPSMGIARTTAHRQSASAGGRAKRGSRPGGRNPGELHHQKRDKSAALHFLNKALKRHVRPEAVVTDGLRSYPAAMQELGNLERREMGRWLNNRAEKLHLPFRRRERAMLRFRRMKSLQKFASVHASLHNHFYLIDRQTYSTRCSAALAEWQSLVG